jgi:hypothetical protein
MIFCGVIVLLLGFRVFINIDGKNHEGNEADKESKEYKKASVISSGLVGVIDNEGH